MEPPGSPAGEDFLQKSSPLRGEGTLSKPSPLGGEGVGEGGVAVGWIKRSGSTFSSVIPGLTRNPVFCSPLGGALFVAMTWFSEINGAVYRRE
jgi:hypothetical protein